MPRTTKPLTDREASQAKPRDKEYTLWDGGGLCLRVKPTGSKTWIFSYYRPATGKRANLSLGQYPAVSLAQARQVRQEHKATLSQGLDPKAYRTEQLQAQRTAQRNTLEHVAGNWMKVKSGQVSEDYAEDVRRSLERHIFPKLGTQPIHQVQAQAVISELEPLAKAGKHETVKRLCQRLNEIMTFAQVSGLIQLNPLAGIGKAFEAPRKEHLPTLQPTELPAFLERLAKAEIGVTTRCLIEWQLHTMTRPAEAAGTRWDEIDTAKGTWSIPAERMKRKKPHTIPLSDQALAILERMRPISGSREFVFPGERNPRQHIHRQTANMAIKRMGYAGKLVAHGLRSLASTTLNEQAFDPDLIETALAHTDRNSVRAAYNRAEYLERRKKMMQWWSGHIEQAATGATRLTGTRSIRAVN